MLRSFSILQRIALLHILAIGVASVATPIAAHMALRATAAALQTETLREHAAALAQHLEAGRDGGLTLDLPPRLRTFYERGYNGFVYAVVDDAGEALFSSLSDHQPVFAIDGRAGTPTLFEASHAKATYSGVSIPEQVNGRRVWLQVAQDLRHPDVIIDNVVSAFLFRVAWITGGVLLLLLAVDILIVRNALRPLREACRNAEAIEPARLELRLSEQDIPRDVLPLIKAVNQALDRLEAGFRAQREFTADAAHELRTPLAVLRARVDLLGDDRARQELRGDIERMAHVVSQIIEIAELETFVPDPGEVADLHEVAAEAIAFMAPLALAQGKSLALACESDPVLVKCSPQTLFQAIRNLLENAVRHTAPGTTVEVDVARQGVVRVIDHGPGVGEAERDLVFRRFWRRDRRTPGSGLGLSIVARIAQAHGGVVAVANHTDGGAVFSLSLPVAQPA